MQANEVARRIPLAEVFTPASIMVQLNRRAKQDVIEALVHRLVAEGRLARGSQRLAVTQILAREKVGTTALNNGVAVPHGFFGELAEFVGAVATIPQGIDFAAVDGKPVDTVFLILAPPHQREEHASLLERLTDIARGKNLRAQLQRCPTTEAIHHFLQGFDRFTDSNLQPRRTRRFL